MTNILSIEVILLLAAGFLGGMLNSVAGGGSLITFPALLFVGVSPISANATNTFASCAGYLSGTYAFRDELYKCRSELPRLILISLFGGVLGAWLLLRTPESLFREAIPWLLLFATVLFVFGDNINTFLKKAASRSHRISFFWHILLLMILLGTCTYGGFFNAGLGIILLSFFSLAGYTNINVMNGMKLVTSTTVSLIAIVLFIYNDLIAWYEGIVVLVGTLLGGYVAAYVSKQISQQYVRAFIILISCGITVYFFVDIYVN